MKCSELQLNLALYSASDAESSIVSTHLDACPLCRVRHDEFQEIRNVLKKIRRPQISAELKNSLKRNVRSEISHSQATRLPFSHEIREWLTMRLMPYSVGVCGSVMIGMVFLSMMFSGMFQLQNSVGSASIGRFDSTMILANGLDPFGAGTNSDITPYDYARTRLGLGSESPSINPQGALIGLTKTLVGGEMKEDEVVVVADVFGNGLAEIAEVVEPSRDRRVIPALQKALATDRAFSPFIPASLENRPDSVRVVLKFQSVNVIISEKRRPRKPSNRTQLRSA